MLQELWLFTEMKTKVTIKDIAKEAGVSTALVSFVMTNLRVGKNVYRVNKETTELVLNVAKSLDYQPNMTARSLKYGKSETIGAIFSDISNPFFSEIARYIEDESWKYGYSTMFGSTDESSERLGKLVDVFISRGVDGLIIVPCEGSDEIISSIIERNIPVVLIDRETAEYPGYSVVLNNEKAAVDLTGKLVAKGCRKIEMLSYTMSLTNIRERESGYRTAMEKAGLRDNIAISRIPHHETACRVEEIVRSASDRGTDAFLFATNTLAVQGMSAIARAGLKIPDDFEVACFDRNDAFDIFDIELAYVNQPAKSFAAEAMKCISDLMSGGHMKRSRVVLEPVVIETGTARVRQMNYL